MTKISPRVDIAFKKIFGVEENKDLLISLINSIVSQEDQVLDLTILNPYNTQNFYKDKLSILDIKAQGIDGKRFNIEIQISDEADYDKRALYYWAKLYTEQLKIAQDYSNLAKAIGIHILNFISIPDAKNYHNIFHITEKNHGFAYFKDLELHTIELSKFTSDASEKLQDIIAKTQSALDIWVAFLTRHDLLKVDSLPKELDSEELRKALTVLDVLHFNEEEREFYEDHLKFLRMEASALKKAISKAREQALAEGIGQGIEIGREQTIEQVAINMLKQKLDDSLIASSTGLNLEEIAKLKI